MNSFDFLTKNIAILAPFILLQLVLMTIALVDLIKRESTKGPKWMWALIIVVINTIGPIIYFVLGKDNE
jgi:hypothetical protein